MSDDRRTQVGEAFVGEGAEAAHLNTVLGWRGGPVEAAWVTSLATPTDGFVRFVAVVRPGVAVKPSTLFVAKARVVDEAGDHARLTWGAAQAGVASGIVDAIRSGAVPDAHVDELLLLAAVWVDPAARDGEAVFANNREATRLALAAGAAGRPSIGEVLAAADDGAWNAFWRP